jgi:hypothetical protein
MHYKSLEPKQAVVDGLFTPFFGPRVWNHVAATVKKLNASAFSLRIYLNGSLVVDTVAAPLLQRSEQPTFSLVSEAGLSIGRADPSRSPPLMASAFVPDDLSEVITGSDSFWASELDEIRIWNQQRQGLLVFYIL